MIYLQYILIIYPLKNEEQYFMASQGKKRQRFEKVAGKRVQFILDKLELLGNCANSSNYDYSEEDVKKMFSAIRSRTRQVEALFQDELSKQDNSKFKF